MKCLFGPEGYSLLRIENLVSLLYTGFRTESSRPWKCILFSEPELNRPGSAYSLRAWKLYAQEIIVLHACTKTIVHACTMIIVHAFTVIVGHVCTIHRCTMIIVHARTMIIVHACTMVMVHTCTMIIVHACTTIIEHACTMSIVHACTMIIVDARTVIIVLACSMIIVHACTMFTVHACTMIPVSACTMIIEHACIMIIVHILLSPKLMLRVIKGGGPGEKQGGSGGASPSMLCRPNTNKYHAANHPVDEMRDQILCFSTSMYFGVHYGKSFFALIIPCNTMRTVWFRFEQSP